MAAAEVTFLNPAEYGLKLRQIQQELGPNSTTDGAREYLNKQKIYKDTEANRKTFGK